MQSRFGNGFSLIEMLIAIAVVAIILTIGMPSFKAMFDGNKLKGGSDALYFMLNLAKTESIKRNANIYLAVQSGENWCVGITENQASNCDCNIKGMTNGCDITSVSSLSFKNLTLNSVIPTSASPATFDSVRGAFTPADKLFTLQSDSGTSVQLRINMLGSVRMCGVNGVLGLYSC